MVFVIEGDKNVVHEVSFFNVEWNTISFASQYGFPENVFVENNIIGSKVVSAGHVSQPLKESVLDKPVA